MKKQKKKNNKKLEFSKLLLLQESALIWIDTIAGIILAFYCVINQYFGELPWVAAMAGFPWTAYGVSQAMYYKKSMAENTCGGVKYEAVLLEAQQAAAAYQNAAGYEFDFTEESTSEESDYSEDYQI